jgi:hypothetical protein
MIKHLRNDHNGHEKNSGHQQALELLRFDPLKMKFRSIKE